MNQGMLPDELVEAVRLPEHLADHPWLGETYGTVAHSVRSIYSGEIGWFEGDPTYLSPLKRTEASARYIKLIGGEKKVMKAAQKAFNAGDFQWSAELSSHVVRTDVGNKAARMLKSDALRQLGYAHFNPNWRNFYLTAAAELDGSIDYSNRADMSAADIIRSFPTEEIINGFRFRIDPKRSGDVNMTMGFRFPDEDKAFALEIRRGIVQFHNSIPEGADAVLAMDRVVLNSIILGEVDVGHDAEVQDDIPTDPMVKLFESGKAKMVEGELAELKRFLSYFDKLNEEPVPIATK
jgi:alkyl sulfatase BDS1-like metallo-beta-lactamase superfamily hydrolase